MKNRCLNPRNPDYPRYGGRGITIDPAWVGDYPAFLRDMGECPPGHSIEREDVDGDYGPNNCLWIPMGQQAVNRSTTRLIDTPLGRMPIKHYAERMGVVYESLRRRVKRGQSPVVAAMELRARAI